MSDRIQWLCKSCSFGIVWTENNQFNRLTKIKAFCTLTNMLMGNISDCTAYEESDEDD